MIETGANILDIKITFQCNNLCLFCVAGDKRKLYPNVPIETIKNVLEQNSDGRGTVVFTGGEPTVREDLPEMVAHARSCGYGQIVIQTNGRRLAYRSYAEALIEAGANQFMVSIHGHKSELHDYLTRQPGSCAETVLGIKNLIALGQTTATNTVITKSSYRNLPEIAGMLCRLGVKQMQFAFPHIDGKARANMAGLVPPMTLVAPYLFQALDIAKRQNRFAVTEGFPFCILGDKKNHAQENLHRKVKVVDEGGNIEDFQGHRRSNMKMKGPDCERCREFEACEGPWSDYPELFTWKEFEPIA